MIITPDQFTVQEQGLVLPKNQGLIIPQQTGLKSDLVVVEQKGLYIPTIQETKELLF